MFTVKLGHQTVSLQMKMLTGWFVLNVRYFVLVFYP